MAEPTPTAIQALQLVLELDLLQVRTCGVHAALPAGCGPQVLVLLVPPGSKIYKICKADAPDAPPARRTTIFVETTVAEATFKTSIEMIVLGT